MWTISFLWFYIRADSFTDKRLNFESGLNDSAKPESLGKESRYNLVPGKRMSLLNDIIYNQAESNRLFDTISIRPSLLL